MEFDRDSNFRRGGVSILANFRLPAILVLGVAVLPGCWQNGSAELGPRNSKLESESTAQPVHVPMDLAVGIETDFSKTTDWYPVVQSELNQLRDYLQGAIRNAREKTNYVAPNVVYAGFDRSAATKTFYSNQVKVSRWRTTNASPIFNENGLNHLTYGFHEPWLSAITFETELTPHKIERDGDSLTVLVVSRAYGQIQSSAGLQSTSLWKTKWDIVSEQETQLDLKMIQVVANEDVNVEVDEGVFFKDITRQVLRRDENSEHQLSYGLDDWAEWIPGLDISGNHGVAVGDANGDGLEDIYVCQPHGLPNLLLSQNQDGTATDIGTASRTNLNDDSRAALFVDLDNDDDEDLIVTTRQELMLFSNNGRGIFQLEKRLLSGFGGDSISAADYDQDGDVDIFVCKYRSMERDANLFARPNSFHDASNGGRNILLRNDEGWAFHDATESVGLDVDNFRFTRCALWSDFDKDGDQDLYVVNEFGADELMENRSGQFFRVPRSFIGGGEASNRSASLGDFNGDGVLDFFLAGNFLSEAEYFLDAEAESSAAGTGLLTATTNPSIALFGNDDSSGAFSPYRFPRPIFHSKNVYGSVAIDINNDGFDDVITTNGMYTRGQSLSDSSRLELQMLKQTVSSEGQSGDGSRGQTSWANLVFNTVAGRIRSGESFAGRERNACFLSIGKKGFANFAQASGANFPDDARAIASVDWDQDGDLDAVMTTRNGPQLRILGNQIESKNQHVQFLLKGTDSNRSAIGARVEIDFSTGDKKTKMVAAGSGILSQSSKVLHFGVPTGAQVNQVAVFWPSGTVQRFDKVALQKRHLVIEGEEELTEVNNPRFNVQLFRDLAPKEKKPLQFDRSVFYPPHGLPSLQFQGEPGAWMEVKNIDEMPLLVLFVDDSIDSIGILREFARNARDVSAAKLDVLAIYIPEGESETSSHFREIKEVVKSCDFPFRFGAASRSFLHKIEVLNGSWFGKQKRSNSPFAWLIDKSCRIRVAYPFESVNTEQVLNDLTFISAGYRPTALEASLRGGIWGSESYTANYNQLSSRLRELGYIDDAKEFDHLNRPNLANQLCMESVRLASNGQSQEAEEMLLSAIKYDSDCEIACIDLGNALIEKAKALQTNEERIPLLSESRQLFERALKRNPTSTQAVLGLAHVARHLNQIDGAITILENFLKINPNEAEVHAEVGRFYYSMKNDVKAMEHLLTAWERRPTLPGVAGDLGFLYLGKGAFHDATNFLKLANRLQPSADSWHLHLAEAEFLAGNYEKAMPLIRQAIERDPDNDVAKSILAWGLATLPIDSLRDSREAIEFGLALFERNQVNAAVAAEICAAAYAEDGDFDNALKMQRKAVERVEENVGASGYSENQVKGLHERLDLFRRKRPYRMTDVRFIPIPSAKIR